VFRYIIHLLQEFTCEALKTIRKERQNKIRGTRQEAQNMEHGTTVRTEIQQRTAVAGQDNTIGQAGHAWHEASPPSGKVVGSGMAKL
jgi:hypothetical protein